MTLILDNYDSFTFNLVQAVAAISGAEPIVVRNDELAWEDLIALRFDNVIISPGPGRPENPRDFGICRRAIEELDCPILGVCLGHQGICEVFGGRIVPAAEVMHGRTSQVFHDGDPLFRDVPSPFDATRYHSLIAVDLPESLERIAWTADGEVMAVRHKTKPIVGVQFHPESIATPHGNTILRNFLQMDAGTLFRTLFASEPYAFWLDWERFSYLGCGTPAAFEVPPPQPVSPDLPFPFQGGLVGYVTYETKPFFIQVERYVVLSKETGTTWFFHCAPIPTKVERRSGGWPSAWNFAQSKEVYLANIAKCMEAIRAGESYEVCLTNELRGRTVADPLTYFETLRTLNPAPYAAYFQQPEVQIACSSPELFLNVTPEGHVTSKPIKGTAPRSEDAAKLAADEKNRAENLMIVDLVRNDLGRVCKTGSVKVTALRQIETYATVHQMVSTIEGDLKPGLNAIDCMRAAFPPGSMTGAPKIRTMEIIERLENRQRGIYSGCIGFLSNTGAAAFNVAIRTAVFADGEVTIGTGGAIVAQSDPESEWNELNLKVEALVRAFRQL